MKRKKSERRRLEEKCDRLFSTLVRLPGYCFECGATDRLQCAHGISRLYRSTRWDFRNAWPLCARCHMRYTHNPLAWDDWLLNEWGDDLYREMRATALAIKHPDIEWLRNLASVLYCQLKEAV